MKGKKYIRPVSIVMSEEMFSQIKILTDEYNVGFSDFIREAIREKLNNILGEDIS